MAQPLPELLGQMRQHRPDQQHQCLQRLPQDRAIAVILGGEALDRIGELAHQRHRLVEMQPIDFGGDRIDAPVHQPLQLDRGRPLR